MTAGPGDVSVEVPVQIRTLGTNISVQKMPSSGDLAHTLEFQMAFAFPIDALVNALLEFQQQMAGPLVYGAPNVKAPPPPPLENTWETDILQLQEAALREYQERTGFPPTDRGWRLLDENIPLLPMPKHVPQRATPSDGSTELAPRCTLDDRREAQALRRALAESEARARREAEQERQRDEEEAAVAERERRRVEAAESREAEKARRRGEAEAAAAERDRRRAEATERREAATERERQRVEAAEDRRLAKGKGKGQSKNLNGKGGGEETTDERIQGEGEGEAHQQKGDGKMVRGRRERGAGPPAGRRGRGPPAERQGEGEAHQQKGEGKGTQEFWRPAGFVGGGGLANPERWKWCQ